MATSINISRPSSNTRFLGPIPVHNPNGISIGSAVFAQLTVEYAYTLQWDTLYPKNCPFPWGIWTQSNIWLLGSTRVLDLNDISIASVVFAGLSSVIDRQTDHATRSVTKTASTYVVLRCGLIILLSVCASVPPWLIKTNLANKFPVRYANDHWFLVKITRDEAIKWGKAQTQTWT